MKFFLLDGPNYALPTEDSEGFNTLAEALHEWKRRRNDISGYWPCWGDGQNHPQSDHPHVVILADEQGVSEAWTLVNLIQEDEMFHYYDEVSES